jgi:hypothetical protein
MTLSWAIATGAVTEVSSRHANSIIEIWLNGVFSVIHVTLLPLSPRTLHAK